MDILKRELAPIAAEGWKEIDRQARQVFETALQMRKIVDVAGPYGWDYNALPLGKIENVKKDEGSRLEYGLRSVRPLVEARIFFELDIWQLDNLARGVADIDFDSLHQAAQRTAVFEEQAILRGMQEGGIEGLLHSSAHAPILAGSSAAEIAEAVARGIMVLYQASIAGPYALIMGPSVWQTLAEHPDSCGCGGCTFLEQIKALVKGPVLVSPLVQTALLVSQRGGDLQLVLGQDISIGYHAHTVEKVTLFLTESFTFRVLEPRAFLNISQQ